MDHGPNTVYIRSITVSLMWLALAAGCGGSEGECIQDGGQFTLSLLLYLSDPLWTQSCIGSLPAVLSKTWIIHLLMVLLTRIISNLEVRDFYLQSLWECNKTESPRLVKALFFSPEAAAGVLNGAPHYATLHKRALPTIWVASLLKIAPFLEGLFLVRQMWTSDHFEGHCGLSSFTSGLCSIPWWSGLWFCQAPHLESSGFRFQGIQPPCP